MSDFSHPQTVRWMREDIDRLKAENARLREALRMCVLAIDEEVQASGDDSHPTIESHAKTADRARKLLKEKLNG